MAFHTRKGCGTHQDGELNSLLATSQNRSIFVLISHGHNNPMLMVIIDQGNRIGIQHLSIQ